MWTDCIIQITNGLECQMITLNFYFLSRRKCLETTAREWQRQGQLQGGILQVDKSAVLGEILAKERLRVF